jgi:hypothetical protein
VIGYKDNTATDQLTLSLTVPGDATLAGSVTFADLSIVAKNFGQSVAKGNVVSWSSGDLTYAGSVTFTDLSIVAKAYGNSLTKQQANELPSAFLAQYDLALAQIAENDVTPSSVPEPGSLSLLATASLGLLARRRRNRRLGAEGKS